MMILKNTVGISRLIVVYLVDYINIYIYCYPQYFGRLIEFYYFYINFRQ